MMLALNNIFITFYILISKRTLSTFTNALTTCAPYYNRLHTFSKSVSVREKINVNKLDYQHVNEIQTRLRVQSTSQSDPKGYKNEIENDVFNRNYHFSFTNPSVINALDQEALRNEENFWWTETTPSLELQEYSKNEGDSKENTEEQKQIESMKKILEKKHRQVVKNLIGEEGIQNISHLVKLRSHARKQRNFDLADDIKKQIQDLSCYPKYSLSDQSNEILPFQDQQVEIDKVPSNNPVYKYRIELKDLPMREGGGSKWRFFRVPFSSTNDHIMNKGRHGDMNTKLESSNVTVLQFAHIALGMAAYASENNRELDSVGLQELVEKVEVSPTLFNHRIIKQIPNGF